MRRYIDEYYEIPEIQWLSPTPEEIKAIVLDYHNNGKSAEDIVKILQEQLYIFRDEEETMWELEVVNNIISGKPMVNRWTNISFK